MKIAIIGGGLTGLVSGFNLLKEGHDVTIFEKEKYLGGLMGSFNIGDNKIEKVYHHIFKTDTEVINLINELGLKDKLEWHKSTVGLYCDGKVYPFSGAIDLLKFDRLDLISKFRLGFVYVWLKFDKNFQKYEDITAVDWMEKWAGKKAYEVIWEPLLKGKFHNYYKDVSMAWLWARIHTRGGSTNEKGEEVLGYIDNGFEELTNALLNKIISKKGKVNLSTEVTSIRTDKNKKVILIVNNKKIVFDKVIAAIPSDVFSNLIDKEIYKKYIYKLQSIKYLGAMTLVFTSKQNLSKYYWHNINDLNSPFLALIQHTNLIDKENYNGNHVYYLGTYVPQDHDYFKCSDREIEKDFFDYLNKIFPKFDKQKIIEKHTFKFKNAQHLVDLNYVNKIPKYKTPIENVFLVNFSQIFPEDRGVNFAVREGNKIVNLI